MPCFRCAHTVADAVNSARGQTVPVLELIAIDDGSDDETPQALRALQEACGSDWLRVVRLERNRGVAAARNVGWEAARGEFVAFLDADDTWHPRKIEIQYEWMLANPAVRVSAHESSLLPRGAPAADLQWRPAVRFPSPRSLLLKNPFITPAVMLKRDLPYRFEEGRRHMEDHLLWQVLALSGERIALIGAPLAAIHKAPFGAAGLSADLVKMERGELENVRILLRKGLISLPAALALSAFSIVKFARRLVLVTLRRIAR